ncbi:MAG: hypothetical protein A2431_00585 [Candidatus Zambryskibacteria bacterium RIFOXYC1_FULL_39_10]|uniref:HTH arsR-type domain-containing protein n=1 Tax=Candidatus Zambryskibacteria bacterium RIFOXYC1_FULL_39_10 TaxID=1802779 RepID=A0A1G2UZA4_9BACT|nr:MAG: hypothetical protein A2431_00585 [Candidatus Zambryskibacteria bacterium RIFOXYC1_FULL_39_10]OHB15640.1 MAG: hypothetical protein A2605_02445 [Candidatus Zambryskibacteria bacterium RIFOXYD1_FULL_39_35]
MKEINIEKILKATASRRRLAIFNCLQGKKELSVSTIAKQIKLSFRSTSKHLSILYAADLLEKEQRSVLMFYKLSTKGQKLFSMISDIDSIV